MAKNCFRFTIFVLIVFIFAFSACSSSGGGDDDSKITLTLDPEGKGYFEYQGKKYFSKTTVKVEPGEYLYFYATTVLITEVHTAWDLDDATNLKAKTKEPVNNNINVSFNIVVLGWLTV